MSKVHVVVTNYLVSQEPPSCEVFDNPVSARQYVIGSIERDITESDRYVSNPIWQQRVLDAVAEANEENDKSDTDTTLYQYLLETFNDTGAHPQYEEYWIFERKPQST